MSLPVVLDLAGRRVVAVGGGPVSARRVRAFVDAGALVRVVSPWLCEDLRDAVAEGLVEWVARDYAGPADLADAWFCHTATGDCDVDATVRTDAASLRLWCVDAGDAASSSAAVPARASVQTPDGPVVVSAFAAGDPRRARRLTRALTTFLTQGQVDLRRERPRPGQGWVALVGGGPGRDDLLTARGLTLLRSADVVVVDRLGPRAVLATLPPTVRVVDVGKAPGHHLATQDEINTLLVEQARLGFGVVRLKGGDPYVLGRGGEERLACEAAGIPVEVVPGVSSAVAVPALAGIPVTHRGLAAAYTMVTGHDEVRDVPSGRDHTLVVLMGVSTLADTARTLAETERGPDCPVAVVERGSLPDQRVTVGTLATIADLARDRAVANPAVVVVGDVVTLAPAWPPAA